jgi:hypothetical protein
MPDMCAKPDPPKLREAAEHSGAFESATDAMIRFLDNEHFHVRRSPAAVRGDNEVEVTAEWTICLDAPATPLTARMIADFSRFCFECCDVALEAASASGAAPKICWRLRNSAPSAEFDRQDRAVESFTIEVTPHEVLITAERERGLLHGTHRLEWMMADRGGPFLSPQVTIYRPAFMPRISNGVFIPGHQTLRVPGTFSDEYFGLLSHFGVNGIHLDVNLLECFRNSALPELNVSDFDDQLSSLRAFNARTMAHGIDLYLCLRCPQLPEDHPVFLAHPEVRGSKVEIFVEGLSGRPWHNLCSGSERVRDAYSEVVGALLTAAPDVAGALMIVGGEGFFHCFTRPAGAANGETSCPNCRGRKASGEVATLVNVVADAVSRAGTHKRLYAWPYSAFVWSADDSAQLDWIERLNDNVSVLSNFDCGDQVQAGHAGARYFDYNIGCIGPSAVFAAQARRLREYSRPIFAKTESSTTPDAFFVPYLPLHFRWQARFEAMREVGVAGFVGQWRFYGATGSPPEELLYRATWDHLPGEDRWLEAMARREFGLSSADVLPVIEGWRLLSSAWDYFPYSAMTSGERAAYMRGPFYLGPAHPLIFNVQKTYGLPAAFRLLRGDAAEMVSAEELKELQDAASPRYISDVLTTLPYGVERYLDLLTRCRAVWSDGLALLRRALLQGNDRARLELNVCETIDCHLATLENVVRFYAARDRLQGEATTLEEFRTGIDSLREIIDREIANAERILPILRQDPRIGFGHCYGRVYDASMVQTKIDQCRYVRDIELSLYSSVLRFHVWLDYP